MELTRVPLLPALRWEVQRARRRLAEFISPSPPTEPIGLLYVGELTAVIERVYFNQRRMIIKAVSSTMQTGRADGIRRVAGLDGDVAFRGTVSEFLGVKTAGSTWEFTFGVDVGSAKVPFDESRER
jgi:hypothetical protein